MNQHLLNLSVFLHMLWQAPVLEKLTTSEMIVEIDLENELRVELERQVEAAREEVQLSLMQTSYYLWI